MAILTLAEAKTLLTITTTDFDTELADYISGAEEAVEFLCGPASVRTVVDVVAVTGPQIALSTTPVISLTSVNGDTYGTVNATTTRVNTQTGVVSLKTTAAPLLCDTYTVTYQAGRATVPFGMKQAVKVILKHQWTTLRRAPGRQQATQDDSTFVPGLGYAIPNAALQMLTPYTLGPAVG